MLELAGSTDQSRDNIIMWMLGLNFLEKGSVGLKLLGSNE